MYEIGIESYNLSDLLSNFSIEFEPCNMLSEEEILELLQDILNEYGDYNEKR